MASKKKHCQYDDNHMQKAIEAVKNGQSTKSAAKEFGVPRTTLSDKVKGKTPEHRQLGAPSILSKNEEKTLVQWIKAMGAAGFPVNKEQIILSVKEIIKRLDRPNPFRDGQPGRYWWEGFCKRHQEISKRVPQNLTLSRARVSEKMLRGWFEEVHSHLVKEGYETILSDPSRVFNADESAFFLNPKGSKVVVGRGEKSVYSIVNTDEKECITVLVNGNAAGDIAPPMVIFKNLRLPTDLVKSVPDHWGLGRNPESGWMTAELFYEYVANVFCPWVEEKAYILKPIIFFVDGHVSHLTMHLSQLCQEKGIILVALLPNATHILQPMDVAVFKSLKEGWKIERSNWRLMQCDDEGGRLKKIHFPKLLEKVITTRLTPEILKNGFRKCGLVPWNPDAIDYKKIPCNDQVAQVEDVQSKSQDWVMKLEDAIGSEKIRLFLRSCNENVEVPYCDTSLFELWKKVTKRCEIASVNLCDNNLASENEDALVSLHMDGPDHNSSVNVSFSEIPEDNFNMSTNSDPSDYLCISGSTFQIVHSFSAVSTQEDNAVGSDCVSPIDHTEEGPSASSLFMPDQIGGEDSKLNAVVETDPPLTHRNDESQASVNDLAPPGSSSAKKNYAPAGVMSPFKSTLLWPGPSRLAGKGKKVSERLPAIVTSAQWQRHMRKKEEKKAEETSKKEKRKQEREEKKEQKKAACELKKRKNEDKSLKTKSKKRKTKDWSSSEGASDSELEKVDDDDDNETDGGKNNQAELTVDDFIIVKYLGECYPGQIQALKDDGFLVRTMESKGRFTFIWPKRRDQLLYLKSDIVKKILPPKLCNNRGFYTFWTTVGWILSTVLMTASMQALSYFNHSSDYTALESAFFLAFHRVGWAVGLGWIVYACATDIGGVVDKVLSWKFFQPLSKLSYSAFLLHVTIQRFRIGWLRTNTNLFDIDVVFNFISDFILSNLLAIPFFLLFEEPFRKIDKFLFRGVTLLPWPRRPQHLNQEEETSIESVLENEEREEEETRITSNSSSIENIVENTSAV